VFLPTVARHTKERILCALTNIKASPGPWAPSGPSGALGRSLLEGSKGGIEQGGGVGPPKCGVRKKRESRKSGLVLPLYSLSFFFLDPNVPWWPYSLSEVGRLFPDHPIRGSDRHPPPGATFYFKRFPQSLSFALRLRHNGSALFAGSLLLGFRRAVVLGDFPRPGCLWSSLTFISSLFDDFYLFPRSSELLRAGCDGRIPSRSVSSRDEFRPHPSAAALRPFFAPYTIPLTSSWRPLLPPSLIFASLNVRGPAIWPVRCCFFFSPVFRVLTAPPFSLMPLLLS